MACRARLAAHMRQERTLGGARIPDFGGHRPSRTTDFYQPNPLPKPNVGENAVQIGLLASVVRQQASRSQPTTSELCILFADCSMVTPMSKLITANQILGELGEVAARQRFLQIGFQFDARSRLEAGIDGIAEVMLEGRPLAKMIAVQVKATQDGRYASETDAGFTYLMKSDDLEYWRGSNLPVILVVYRQSDESLYWQEVPRGMLNEERRLIFDKANDKLDIGAVDRLAALTVPKSGFGYYVPPLGEGEEALVNILPVNLPPEVFVASTPHTGKSAAKALLDREQAPRFDWVIRDGSFWAFSDPRTTVCSQIVDLGDVDAIDTAHLALHEDIDEQNHFSYLLKCTLQHQVRDDLAWSRDRKLFYFRALEKDQSRVFAYDSAKKRTAADVVNVSMSKKEPGRVGFVRHHAFEPRFELLGDQWCLVINPTYYFTTNGFTTHAYPPLYSRERSGWTTAPPCAGR